MQTLHVASEGVLVSVLQPLEVFRGDGYPERRANNQMDLFRFWIDTITRNGVQREAAVERELLVMDQQVLHGEIEGRKSVGDKHIYRVIAFEWGVDVHRPAGKGDLVSGCLEAYVYPRP